MADDINCSASFGQSNNDSEELPIIVAQRFLNIFRQLHIFSDERREAFNKMLLELPPEVKSIFQSLPGGTPLQEYMEDLEQKSKGLEPVARHNHQKNSNILQEALSENRSTGGTTGGEGIINGDNFARILASSLAQSNAEIIRELQNTRPAATGIEGGSGTGGGFDGMNVTIPYKKAVIPYCAELSPIAQKLQSVNVLVRREDGTLYGDNADAYGFAGMVRASGIQIDGKKTLVLGSGGASSTGCAVLEEMGARSVTIISRKGEDNYNNLDRHADAEVIVNTTPVGMYPNCGVSPVDLSLFPKLEGVLDIVYNPARTAFVLQAEKLGIPYMSGLYMLVAQAKRTAEVFENRDIPDSETERIWKKLSLEMQNIVLIGLRVCCLSTVAARLAEKFDLFALDSDAEIEEKNGMSRAQLIEKHGEAEFRELESEAIAALGKRSGAVIATGGGCVTREENYDLLHQNGIIFWLERDVSKLPREGRPLSAGDLAAMYDRRKACYERFADHIVDNNGTVEDTVQAILDCLK